MLFNTLSVLVLTSLVGMTAHAETISLDLAIGEKAPLNRYFAREFVSKTASCLNTALTNAGHPGLRVAFVTQLRDLSPEEEGGLSVFDFQPALTKHGSPIEGMVSGVNAPDYTVYVSKRIPRSHVKAIWSVEIPITERFKALELADAQAKCESYYRSEVQSHLERLPVKIEEQSNYSEATAKYRAICDDAVRKENAVPKRNLPLSNEIYIAGGAREGFVYSFAREFLRTWGGLSILPQKSSIDQTNLMGANPACELTVQQIQAIVEYKRTGVRQR